MTAQNASISIVIPVYGSLDTLEELYLRLVKTLDPICEKPEIIFVNDGSPGEAWTEIRKLCMRDKRVKGINLSRNFGQHCAITAGLKHSTRDWVVVMDCDLQDAPEEIANLFNKVNEGFEAVIARRIIRNESIFKVLFSRIFYKLFSYLTDTKQDSAIANFGIYSRKLINAILEMGDYVRFLPVMVKWVGFEIAHIDVVQEKRKSGKSGYTLSKLIHLAISVLISFSDKPLRLTIKFGFLFSVLSFVLALGYLIKYFIVGIPVSGWTSLILSIWFLSGVIVTILGLIGLYIGKIFEKVKDRPVYIINETLNFDKN
jgi:glycosyltransferase involved in cell wall biosynthesis